MRFKPFATPLVGAGLMAASPVLAQDSTSDQMMQALARQQALIEAQAAMLKDQQAAITDLRKQISALGPSPSSASTAASPPGSVPAPVAQPVAVASALALPPHKAPSVSMKIGGWVQFDTLYFPDARPGELEDLLYPRLFSVDPSARGRGRFHLSARDTRLNFEVGATSSIGTLRAVSEFDFFGTVVNNAQSQFNAYDPRLRLAFVEWTDRAGRLSISAGQNWSTFANPTSYASIYNPLPLGSVFVRQAQLRVSYRPAPGLTVAVAIENPQGDTAGAKGSAMNEQFDGTPDLVASLRLERKWGSLQLGGLLRRIEETQPEGAATAWGLSGSGTVLLPLLGGRQKLRFQATYGTGVGRYIGELGAGFDGISAPGQRLRLEHVLAANMSYEHFFAPWLSGTIQGSYVDIKAPVDVPHDNIRTITAIAGNVVFHPIAPLDLALEYIRASRIDVDRVSATRSLARFSARYRF